jgi:hypothetical protein
MVVIPDGQLRCDLAWYLVYYMWSSQSFTLNSKQLHHFHYKKYSNIYLLRFTYKLDKERLKIYLLRNPADSDSSMNNFPTPVISDAVKNNPNVQVILLSAAF